MSFASNVIQGLLSTGTASGGLDFTNVGAAIGGIPQQKRDAEIRRSLLGFDQTTPAGQIEYLKKAIQLEKDPAKKNALGQQLFQVRKQQRDENEREAADKGKTNLIATLKSTQDPELITLAEQVDAGNVTVASAESTYRSFKRAEAVATQGLAARKNLIKSLDLQDSSYFQGLSDEQLKNMPPSVYTTTINAAEKTHKKQARIDKLSERAQGDERKQKVVEDYELGLYTDSNVMKAFTGAESLTFANRQLKLVNGVPVFVADVQKEGEDEFVGYLDPETQEWTELTNAASVQDLPDDTEKKLSRITEADLDVADSFLLNNEDYNELSKTDKINLRFHFASLVRDYTDNNKVDTPLEALEKAKKEVLSMVERGEAVPWYVPDPKPTFNPDIKKIEKETKTENNPETEKLKAAKVGDELIIKGNKVKKTGPESYDLLG